LTFFIIIIPNVLGRARPLSPSPKSLFKGLYSI